MTTITIEKRDLFTAPEDYALAHCISADAAMGAGIALEFVKRFPFLKTIRQKKQEVGHVVTMVDNGVYVFNLVTKENYYDKPTLETLAAALEKMFQSMNRFGITKVAMPKIGCGLDKLKWNDVYPILQELTEKHDFEILVCTL